MVISILSNVMKINHTWIADIETFFALRSQEQIAKKSVLFPMDKSDRRAEGKMIFDLFIEFLSSASINFRCSLSRKLSSRCP